MRTMVLAYVVVSAWSVAYGQTTEFEVASVKQIEPLQPDRPDLSFVGTSGKPFKIVGNRVTVNGTLHALVAAAYSVKEYQVLAAPNWADTLRYTIVAKSPGDTVPTQDQVRLMLQSLLADRFQLKFHPGAKEMAVYHLRQVKKSSLLKPAAADETFSWNISAGAGGTVRSKATKESIGDFVQLVGVSADRPVIDKTGLTGDIDYDISITPPAGGSFDEVNRAIIYAVMDQLGLKLEPARDTMEVLVVDRVDKPSEN